VCRCLYQDTIFSPKILFFRFDMAFVAIGYGKCSLFIVAGSAEFTFVHRVHGHLLCAFLHRPDFGMALVALEDLCMEFMTEFHRCCAGRLIYNRCFGEGHLSMAICAVCCVGKCFLAIVTGETELSGTMVGKFNLHPVCLHREQFHVASIASIFIHMNYMLVFDRSFACTESNRSLRIQTFPIPVTGKAVLVSRRM
jgi:hypothetical protein